MKTKDLMTITSIALGTAALTVIAFWSGPLEAGAEADALAAKIQKPKLLSHGIEMTLAALDGRTFKAGEEPSFVLTAVNPSAETAAVTVRIAMTASSPADMMSRVPRLPSALWHEQQTLMLKPHETKVLPLSVPKKLPANSMIAVSLQERDPLQTNALAGSSQILLRSQVVGPSAPSIVAMNFSTAVPVAQTASVK